MQISFIQLVQRHSDKTIYSYHFYDTHHISLLMDSYDLEALG